MPSRRASGRTATRLAGVLAAAGCVAGCGAASAPEAAEMFDVATWDWDRQGAMDALVTGTLTIDDRGCTFAAHDLPVLFPNAVGLRFDDGTRAVAEVGSLEVYAVDGESFQYGGGYLEATTDWTDRCGPHDGEVAFVHDDPAS